MKKQRGQTLLEILLAFGVSILVLSAVILGILTSLNSAQYAKNQGLANSYAQEGVAVVRQIRDSGWPGFSLLTDVNYCLPQNVSALVPYDGNNCGTNGIVGIFTRSIVLEHNSPNCANGAINGSEVTVKVSWADNKCPVGIPRCHDVELITCFSNTDQKLAP